MPELVECDETEHERCRPRTNLAGLSDTELRGASGRREHIQGRRRHIPRLLHIAIEKSTALAPLVSGTRSAVLGAAIIGALGRF